MGSDIDLFVEKRNADGKWELMFPAPELAEQLHGEHERDRKYGPDHMPGWAWYSQRNYRLFGLLAGVRGQVDSPWEHRGIPKDSPIETLDADDRIGRSRWDGHSHSYVTLAEFKVYNWGTLLPQLGWMNVNEYRHFKDKGDWIGYAQGVGGTDVKRISNEEMDQLFEDGTLIEFARPEKPDVKFWMAADEKTTYVTMVEWFEPMKKACGLFLNKTLPQIENLGGNPEDIRLVYWFDC